MRIERLDLLRYGGFTDRSLVFRPGAQVHIVHGANEAGKSTALAAIADLLFGFPQRGAWDFLHDLRSLRLAASLVNRRGERISFRRRRSTKATLLTDDDSEAPLRDDALAPFLGRLDREVFETTFGLDTPRLQQGAQALLSEAEDGRGGVFAAASGRHAVAALRQSLEMEANAIFAPRASKDRRFYQALDRHEAASRAMRDSELREGAWKALLADVDTTHRALDEAREALRANRAASRRLQRLLSLAPSLAELLDTDRALAAFVDLEEVTPTAARALEEAARACDGAQAERREAGARLEEADAVLAASAVDNAILAAEAEVSALVGETGAYRQRLEQIPRVQGEADAHDAEIAALLLRLGLRREADAPLGRDEFASLYPGDAALATLADRTAWGTRLAEARGRLAVQLDEEAAKLSGLGEAPAAAASADPAPLVARLASLEPELDALDAADELAARLRTVRREIDEAAQRLDPPVTDIERIASLPLPSAGEIDALRSRLATGLEALHRRRSARVERQAAVDRRAALIAEAERAADLPTPEAIRAARAARDAAVGALGPAFGYGRAAGDAAAEELARLIAAADALADRAVSEADRVSRLRAEREALAADRAELAVLDADLAELTRAHERATADWVALFRPLAIEPAAPERMLDWRRALDGVLAKRTEAAELADRLAGLQARAEALRPTLDALAVALGVAPDPGVRIRPLARQLQAALTRRQEQWTSERVQAGRRADLEERLQGLRRERERLEAERAEWQERFDAALVGVGLAGGLPIAAAEAALAAWRDLPTQVEKRDQLARRVAGMRRDNARFEAAAAALAAALAPALADLSPAETVRRLAAQREAALAAAARRDDARTKRAAAAARVQTAEEGVRSARAALAEAFAALPSDLLGQPGPAVDPAPLLARLAARDAARARRDESLRRFEQVAEGVSPDAARAELDGFDRDRATIELDLLHREEDPLTRAVNEAHTAHQDALARRQAAETGEGADRAAFARRAAEVEMLEAAREWCVLRIATLMLDAALVRHREQEGDGLMEAAGAIFRQLTGGAWQGLSRPLGEDDAAILIARRADGRELVLSRERKTGAVASGFSEGTLNQLYLALRLAYLCDYAERAEPAPFIGDDLFQSFDDTRTAAGLRVLASLSDRLQPILFTHHRSVVDLARAALGEGADVIEL